VNERVTWDPRKAEKNKRRHGVTFEEAASVLSDYFSATRPDPIHSGHEEREVTIGTSTSGRLLVVVHTAGRLPIRIISARMATRYERQAHED
jgi:hypothetical protein